MDKYSFKEEQILESEINESRLEFFNFWSKNISPYLRLPATGC